MTVLQLISSGGYYGAESMLVALSSALPALGCQVIAAVFHDSRWPHLEVAEQAGRQGVPVEWIACNGRWDSRAVQSIQALLHRVPVDILHTHGYKADLYGYLASRPCRCARVATCHNWPSRQPSMRFYAGLDRLVLRRFDRVAAVSETVAETLQRWGVRDVRHVPNGVPLARFQVAAPALRQELRTGYSLLVGFAGRLSPEKGGDVLLRAAQRVIAARPDTAFVFVGEGPCDSAWRKLASVLGIADHVMFVGRRDDMPGVYASLDLLVLPSLQEAMPICLLEALAAELPVVATRVGSVAQIVIPGETGMLVEPGDPAALAAAIVQSLNDRSGARRMAERGRRHVEQYYSDKVMATAYLDLYSQALEGKGSRPAYNLANYGQ